MTIPSFFLSLNLHYNYSNLTKNVTKKFFLSIATTCFTVWLICRKSKWTFKCVYQLKKLCDKKTLSCTNAFDRLMLYNIPTIKFEELRMIVFLVFGYYSSNS